ncbi:Cytochrome oxidase assembly protein ShyY1 [Streptomyces sp. 2112.3]|nr:cytochrome oxidase assembly protein ShyY1 [Streptomyces sp. 2321.6]SDR37173.1 Cytochrome oxidase assembly protein ShyY1 [Streptomyces sp. KS_16]SED13508.1 Cytochrome oxidase assembly protein ShyY1 [Streptomyces sp. 2133.1]SEE65705.1 Cytochrome oxidase assembly protein ShyY1 [Streptomyces sp. 2112.3]SNC69996.1 Cytochrome oxidase assembly protein ShyY1 [Streptomyces sp. 2114.4]
MAGGGRRGRCGPVARAPYRGGVYRFLLTPRWWGINVFAVLAIPLCLFMGSWQLSRFEDRVNTHQQQEDRSARAKTEAARPLGGLLPVDTVTSGRQASARGHYDTGHQLLVPDRTLKDKHGRQQGFYVLDLLRTDGGKALPVVRGWLPGDAGSKADTAKVPAPPKGEVTVTGALQASENQGTDGVQAGGGLPQGQLGMISAASLVNIVPYEVYDAWITLTDTQAPLRAVPPAAAEGSGLDLKAFQNLGYTGEWFVFAGFVVFMWFRLFRRDAEAARDAALGIVAEEDPVLGGAPGRGPAPEGGAAQGEERGAGEGAAAPAPRA